MVHAPIRDRVSGDRPSSSVLRVFSGGSPSTKRIGCWSPGRYSRHTVALQEQPGSAGRNNQILELGRQPVDHLLVGNGRTSCLYRAGGSTPPALFSLF